MAYLEHKNLTPWLDLAFEDLKMEWKHVLVALVLSVAQWRISEAADAMSLLASGFLAVLDECKKELNLEEGLMTDLYNYWKRDFADLRRETGCAIICMSKKLDMLTDDGKFHHGSAKELAMKHGAGEELATQMVTIIHSCESKNDDNKDVCWRVLEVAKCFRVGIHELHWEPKVDLVITEVLAEI